MSRTKKNKNHHLKKLNYLWVPSAFVLAFAVIGLIYQFQSSAATLPNFQSAAISNSCITVNGTDGNSHVANATVNLQTCKNYNIQDLTFSSQGNNNYLILYHADNGDHCLMPLSSVTKTGTAVVSNTLEECNETTAELWQGLGPGGYKNQLSGLCLTENGLANKITIQTCNVLGEKSQQWNPAPPPPAPIPSPNPSPSPSPSPSPKPTESSGSTSKQISVSPASTQPSIIVSTTPQVATNPAADETLSSDNSNENNPATISKITVSGVTKTTAILSWRASQGSSYIVQYGTNSVHFSSSKSFYSSKTSISIELSELPSGHQIFASITPYTGNNTGNSKYVNFVTASTSYLGLIVAALGFLMLLAFFFVLLKFKKDNEQREKDFKRLPPSKLELFPPEDQESIDERLNWWLPDEMKDKVTHNKWKKNEDEFPDMFTEGRRRLDDEDKAKKSRR